MIGRKKEIEILNNLYNSDKSQFVAVYGRRRVGKTFLINSLFEDRITFKHAGLSPIEVKENNYANTTYEQIKHFYNSLILYGMEQCKMPDNWLDAFLLLEQFLISKDDGKRQLVFIDELPWLDTAKSGFMTAFEGFWNNFGCARKNLMLIVCGSATSWISDKLINNHGGLYGRLTYELKLSPFSLLECEEYFKSEKIKLSRYDIIQSYMITGGIPFYLSYYKRGLSLAQNIDEIFFKKNAPLSNEFDRLFSSVFNNPLMMIELVNIIGSKRCGLTRNEIIEKSKFLSGGVLSNALSALEASDFIVKYVPFGLNKNQQYYKLTDCFCIFYLKFMSSNNKLPEDFWLSNISSQSVVSWRGIAFENVCFNHIYQIKKALGINGVITNESAWSKHSDEGFGTQIDLLIERRDNVINMCEIKFYGSDFVVDKNYDRLLRNRIALLEAEIPRKFVIHPTLITTYGIKYNEYSGDFLKVITMDSLFE